MGRAGGHVTAVTSFCTGITGIVSSGTQEQAGLKFLLNFCELALAQAVMDTSEEHICTFVKAVAFMS